jgi:hypothetical protein
LVVEGPPETDETITIDAEPARALPPPAGVIASGAALALALRIGCASCERWNADSKLVETTRSKSSAL